MLGRMTIVSSAALNINPCTFACISSTSRPLSRVVPPVARKVIMRTATRILIFLVFLLAMLVPTAGATAAPADNERYETFFIRINGCNGGEVIELEGTVHMVNKQQENGSFSYTTVHAQGIGDKGNEYVANATFKSRLTSSGSRTVEETFRLNSKGAAPNDVVVFSIESDGQPTFEPDCRG